jgi:Mg-chelatase subunit ChlD
MFLRETLPRFQSRSRLEHVPLLLLRCAALCLLAFAFARPFLVQPAATGPARADRRTVLLVDTSASMRRAGVWTRAIEEAKSVLAEAGSAERVCVMSFDRTTQTRIGFEQWATLEPAQRAGIAGQEIARLAPGWALTNLGHALVTAAEALEEDEVNDGQRAVGARRIVLVSDLQQGSHLDALLIQWPKRRNWCQAIPCRAATHRCTVDEP